MIRMSKLTDYGILLMSYFAERPEQTVVTARDLSAGVGLPLPTVGKLLKLLSRAGILEAQRGAKGGYRMFRHPKLIPISEIIVALEGPIAIIDCAQNRAGSCELESSCRIKHKLQMVNRAVQSALEKLSLADLGSSHSRFGMSDPATGAGMAARGAR